eukprot:gene9009-biopygen6493
MQAMMDRARGGGGLGLYAYVERADVYAPGSAAQMDALEAAVAHSRAIRRVAFEGEYQHVYEARMKLYGDHIFATSADGTSAVMLSAIRELPAALIVESESRTEG